MDEKKYAVLIDADNIGKQYIGTILDEISKKGTVTIKRIYGDWTNPCIHPWKETLLEYSIIPVQQYSYTKGKNSTDSAMIIDAMDILYSNNVDGFCLVSSDSDFTRLAARLRESGKDVIGMGKETTPSPFVKACCEFKYVDLFHKKLSENEDYTKPIEKTIKKTKPPTHKGASKEVISKSIMNIIKESSDDDGWIAASLLGARLQKKHPDFDPRNFGYNKLVPFLQEFNLEIKKCKDTNNKSNPDTYLVYVKIKSDKGSHK